MYRRRARGNPPSRVSAVILALIIVDVATDRVAANVRSNVVPAGAQEPQRQRETTIVHFTYNDPNDLPDAGVQDVILAAWNDLNHPDAAGNVSVGYGRSVGGGPFVHVPGCLAPAASVGQACANNGQCDNPGGAGNGICGQPLVVPPPAAGLSRDGDPVLVVDKHAGLDGALANPRVYLVQMNTPPNGNQAIYVFWSDDGGRTFPPANSENVSLPPDGQCVAGNLNAGALCTPIGAGGGCDQAAAGDNLGRCSALRCSRGSLNAGVACPAPGLLNGCDRAVAGDGLGVCANTEDDKPWIAVDQRGGGVRPPDGNVYVCWTRFSGGRPRDSQIMFARKSGPAFGAPVALSALRAVPSYVQGCQVSVDIDGHVYVAWAEFLGNPQNLPMIQTRHANPPAGAAAAVFDAAVPAKFLRRTPPNVEGCAAPNWLFSTDPIGNSFPSLATDAFNGDVYMAFSEWRGPKGGNGATRFDVLFKKAARPAGFLNWIGNGVVRINNDGNTATDQWLPAIVAYPPPVRPRPIGIFSTTLKTQWYDKRRAGTANDLFELWSATSGNGGAWANIAVSTGGQTICAPGNLNAGAACTPPGTGGGCNLAAAGDNLGFCQFGQSLTAGGLNCRPGDYNTLDAADISVQGPDGNGIAPGSNFLHGWTDTRANAGTSSETFYFTQSLSSAPGDFPALPQTSRGAIVSFTAPATANGTVGVSTTVALSGSVINNGPTGASMDTWYSVSVPNGITASIVGANADDTCYGPKDESDEPEDAPDSPVIQVNCGTAPTVNALGTTDDLANGAMTTHNKSLRIDCQSPGTFTLTLTAGVGPVLPLAGSGDVVDDDVSDNGSTRTLDVTCTCSSLGPFPTISFANKTVITWSVTRTDLIRGDLNQLRATNGNFATAVLACLLNDVVASSVADATVPGGLGQGFFYLARRATECTTTYSSGAPKELAGRDTEIALSANRCP